MKHPPREYQFDIMWLELASQLADAGTVILNPRDIRIRSLAGADAIWMRDQGRYAREKKFQKDLHKRPAELR